MKLHTLFLLLALTTLAACGGGSNSSGATAPDTPQNQVVTPAPTPTQVRSVLSISQLAASIDTITPTVEDSAKPVCTTSAEYTPVVMYDYENEKLTEYKNTCTGDTRVNEDKTQDFVEVTEDNTSTVKYFFYNKVLTITSAAVYQDANVTHTSAYVSNPEFFEWQHTQQTNTTDLYVIYTVYEDQLIFEAWEDGEYTVCAYIFEPDVGMCDLGKGKQRFDFRQFPEFSQYEKSAYVDVAFQVWELVKAKYGE
jgi:heme-degrading monooxygenase HmoA